MPWSRSVDLLCEGIKFRARRFDIKGFIGVGSEDPGELGRDQAAEDQVGVCDCEISAFAIACGAGTDTYEYNITILSMG